MGLKLSEPEPRVSKASSPGLSRAWREGEAVASVEDRTGQDRTGLVRYNRIRRWICPEKSHATIKESTKNTTEPQSSDAIEAYGTKPDES
jgi:hypothetical protein